jgi:hypothetical protein
MSNEDSRGPDKPDTRLLPGVSARAWERLNLLSYPVALVGLVAVGVFASHAPREVWFPIVIVFVGFTAVTWIARAIRDRTESLAGYTTRSKWRVNLEQLDPKTGKVVRTAGTPFASAGQSLEITSDDSLPVVAATEMPLIAQSPDADEQVPLRQVAVPTLAPSGNGVVLAPRPSAMNQLALTILIGSGFSILVAVEVAIHFPTVHFGGYFIAFIASLAAFALIWLALLGARTLDRRRLIKKFPGTLVFSFSRSADVSTGLRRLNLIEPINDYDVGTIEAVADLRGITLWQGNPPEQFVEVPWTIVHGIHRSRELYPNSTYRTMVVTIEVGRSETTAQLPLFSVSASTLPFPGRGEIGWVERQLQSLFRKSQQPE